MLRTNIRKFTSLANWIGGRRVEPVGLEYLPNVNPFTEEVVNLVPKSTEIDVNNAVSSAATAFPFWSALPREKRAEYLMSIAQEIENNLEEFAIAESQDTGKPLSLSRNLDISRSVHNFRFFADLLLKEEPTCFEQSVPQAARHHVLHRPVGVVGLISPWNLPLYLLSWKVAPALAAGCTIVAKPSELTPSTASLLAEASQRAGIPDGVLNIVHGYGQGAGDAIVRHKDVAAISFTGGTSTGAIVATQAAPMFKKISLELGGKNPAIVMRDADIDVAVKGVVRSGFLNSGQICLCGSRVLVHADVYEEFLAKMKTEVESLKCGDPSESSTDIGPVVSQDHLNKIKSAVQAAVDSGAQVLTGGPGGAAGRVPDKGFFFPPTVLTDVSQDSDIVQEEVFGPVVTVQRFTSVEEALALANGVRYGLAASIWTQDLTTTELPRVTDTSDLHKLSVGLDCGLVWVNCWLLRDLRIPFGGTKQSGVGREGGYHSLEFFSETKSLCFAEPAPIPPMPSKMGPVGTGGNVSAPSSASSDSSSSPSFFLKNAPAPVGAYKHARVAGGLLFLAGVGPRTPGTNAVPGGPIRDPDTGEPLEYDIEAQTRACIENVKTILEGSGSSMDKVVDVQCFLINMDRDFKGFNKVYAEYFSGVEATRTTIAIRNLPTPIAVELKVIALP